MNLFGLNSRSLANGLYLPLSFNENLSAFDHVFFPGSTLLIAPGNLYSPGPGPSIFFGLKWPLLLTSESNLPPIEKLGAVL